MVVVAVYDTKPHDRQYLEEAYGLPTTVHTALKLPTAEDLANQFSTKADFLDR